MSTVTSKNSIKSPLSISNNNQQRNQDIFRNNNNNNNNSNNINNNSSIRSSRSSYSSSYSYTTSSSSISSRPISQDLIIESGALGVFATSNYFKQQEFENNLNKKLNNLNQLNPQFYNYNYNYNYTSPIKKNRQSLNINISSPIKLDYNNNNNNHHIPNMSSTSTTVNLTPLPPMETNSIPPLNLNEQIILSSVNKNKKKISNVDVLFKLFDLLSGKDKLGKVIQYGLRIIMYYVINLKNSNYLKNLENESILNYNNNNNKGLNLILNLINNSKFILLILLNQFEKRSIGLINALSIYRQLLRAGKTPLKVIRLFNKSKFTLSKLINSTYYKQNNNNNSNILTNSINIISKDWINESTFNDLTSLYYSWFDESLLAFKLGLLSNKKYRKISSDHEAIAWYILIINGLRKEYNKLNQLNIKENQIKINYQVKKRAKALMYSMQNNNNNNSNSSNGNLLLQSPISSPSKLNNYYQYQSPSIRSKSPNGQSVISNGTITTTATNIDKELEEIYKEKYMVQLELFKLSCDFIFDTISVFDIKVSQPFHLIFGFGAGFTSLSKIWMDVRENLENE
ncbi:hypothetical protein B5S29_g4071 [[Candida] boidinii]|uniref:Unnamed protein product n=1 Tax=Candida boidinii TaxID=5477 RepID=A0ACB5TNW1_CANBO|nr:hypothetical protein B5S29_g4071 [[Candida] boidinii]GME92326.1 unnamed protein product [[Candida] boidinii]